MTGSFSFAVVALVLILCVLPAQAEPQVRQVGKHLYAYISDVDSSCNSTFLVGSRGILVVDTGFDARAGDKLLRAIRKISDLPVRYIVNTHYHRDHQAADGIVGPKALVITTAWTRQRTRDFLKEDFPRLEHRLTGEALKSLHSTRYRLADITFQDQITVWVDDQPVKIFFPGKAHTSGDAMVYFPSEEVLSSGDLFLHRSCPAMDQGSVLNWVRALDKVLKRPLKWVVPGHFELSKRAGLQRFHDYLAALVQQVKQLRASGASLKQVEKEIKLPAFSDFRQYPQYEATFADNAAVVYRELEAGKKQ